MIAPPAYYPHALVNASAAGVGVVHVAWRELEPGRHQMACGYVMRACELYEKRPLPPVTCFWCLAGYLPWLRWGPDA